MLGSALRLLVTTVITSKHDFLYLDEWVQFHRSIGFDHINIIDTTADKYIYDFVELYPDYITLMTWAESGIVAIPQIYNSLCENIGDQQAWHAFLDPDEFIVLKRHHTVQDLVLDSFHGVIGALSLNTFVFGSSGQKTYSTEPVVKRFTQRGSTPHIIAKTIAYMPDIHYWTNISRPVLREGKKFFTVHGSDHAAVIHKYPIKSIQEFNWNQQQNMDNLMEYLTDIEKGVLSDCFRVRESKVFVPADGLLTAVVGSSTPVFCGGVSKLFSAVTDTSSWDQFTRTALNPQLESTSTNCDAFNQLFTYNHNDEVLNQISAQNDSEILFRIPLRLRYGTQDVVHEFVLYKNLDIVLQAFIFCIDNLIPVVYNSLFESIITNLRARFGMDITNDVLDYQTKFNNCSIEPAKSENSHVLQNEFLHQYHRDECYAVWREQQQQQPYMYTTRNLGDMSVDFTDNTVKTVMYVIHHDNVSERIVYDNLTANGTFALNSNVKPVRIASSVFFESVIYRDVLPYRYRKEWENVDYVGISTYKTITENAAFCTHEIEGIMQLVKRGHYDVIPLVRHSSSLMFAAVTSHGRMFRKAWYLLLEELGYSRDVILKYEHIPGFYRNTMYIRPAWLVRLSQFMSRAIDTVLMNSTLYNALSQTAKYQVTGDVTVAMKIFNTTTYQQFPFVFERLPVFFLTVEGAKICQGNEDCPSNLRL